MKTLSDLLTSIKMDLGIYQLAIPVDNLDEQLYDVIKLRTIKTYSQFYPYKEKIDVTLGTLEREIDTTYARTIYDLPNDIVQGREIITIYDINQRPTGLGYGDPVMPTGQGGSIIDSMMFANVNADILSAIAPKQTFEFIYPNKLILYNAFVNTGRIVMDIGTTHHENLMSIPPRGFETFEELALLDVKRFLYGKLKHYNDLQTAHGTINLRIDDWANAESERRELLKEWETTYHFAGPPIYFL